jgi:hypothetical protein
VTIRYGELRNFFLTRFHEDWQLDAGSRAGVVDDFVSTENLVFVAGVVTDLRSLLAEEIPEDELHRSILREYGLSFDPWKHEISMDEWLRGLLRELVAAAGQEDG